MRIKPETERMLDSQADRNSWLLSDLRFLTRKQEFTTTQGVAEICTDVISENKKDFKKLSQEETDELLRKLLYKKLYDEKPKKSKEKKSKLKIKKTYSSSESESSDWYSMTSYIFFLILAGVFLVISIMMLSW